MAARRAPSVRRAGRRATHGATPRPGPLVAVLLAAVLAGPAACGGARRAAEAGGGRVARVSPADAGAASAAGAVSEFLSAARAADVRAMGLLFGTAAGPVAGRDGAIEVEKRMRALACYLAHDSARVVDELPAVGGGARRVLTVALRQRELARESRFTAVPGPSGRWYVEAFDVERLSAFCRPQ
jgi:hypothetical protein